MSRKYSLPLRFAALLMLTFLSGCLFLRQAPAPPPEPVPYLASAPRHSDAASLNFACFGPDRSLGQVEDWLISALNQRGYKRKLVMVPGGFGILTAFERVDDNNRTVFGDLRWNTGPFANGLWDQVWGTPNPGRYRAFLFVFAPNMPNGQATASFDSSQALHGTSTHRLSPALRVQRAGPTRHLQAFVYEYRRHQLGGDAVQELNGVSIQQHLGGAGLQKIRNGNCA